MWCRILFAVFQEHTYIFKHTKIKQFTNRIRTDVFSGFQCCTTRVLKTSRQMTSGLSILHHTCNQDIILGTSPSRKNLSKDSTIERKRNSIGNLYVSKRERERERERERLFLMDKGRVKNVYLVFLIISTASNNL